MNYLKFSNKGEITKEAIVLLGASTKREQTGKIGFFGSGNKFALAYLLRNGYDVSIYGGLTELKVDTISKNLGDQVFDVITVCGQETSITTEFGAKWELWQALREIYSNALDEGNGQIEMISEINPKENETHYYIKIRAELIEWFGNFNNYFSENKRVLFENKHGQILKKHDDLGHLYRKGISVLNPTRNSLYDYNVANIAISEDRIVKYSWQIGERVWALIYSCTDKEIIKNVLMNSTKGAMFENSISDLSDLPHNEISEEFKEVLAEMKLCDANMSGYLSEEEQLNTTILPSKVFKSINFLLKDENLGDSFKVGIDGVMYREQEFSPIHLATIRKVKDFLEEAKWLEPLEYPLILGTFDDKKIMGYADRKNEKIVVSEIGIDKGANYLLEIIIEEYIHLKFNVNDNTRKFQDACIQEMVKIMKIKNSFVL